VRPIGRSGHAASLLGRLGHAWSRGGEEQASRADGWVSAHSAGIKRKSFLFSKSFYNLQTNLNSFQIRILMTSTHKKNIRTFHQPRKIMHQHEMRQSNIYLNM
jgi:hypothetical protein